MSCLVGALDVTSQTMERGIESDNILGTSSNVTGRIYLLECSPIEPSLQFNTCFPDMGPVHFHMLTFLGCTREKLFHFIHKRAYTGKPIRYENMNNMIERT